MRKSAVSVAVTLGLLTATPAFAMSDQAFVAQAIKGDNAEIMIGHLAGEKGGTAAVRSVGKMIEGDHSQNRIQAVRLADGFGMTAPTAAAPDAAALYAKLQTLSGAAFDKTFAQAMVADHQKTIAAFKTEAATGKGPVARYAEMSLPTLEHHLRVAQSLAAK